jgi:uncharacterized protein (TIGR02996 family)
MDTAAALIAAVKDRPDDDTPRLAYADWCDDNAGDTPDPERARGRAALIRWQCRPENSDTNWPGTDPKHWLRMPTGELFYAPAPVAPPAGAWLYRRGFIEWVECPAADWLTHADAILAEHPVSRVRLLTWPTIAAVNEWERERFGRSNQFGFYESARSMFADRWPGINFALPALNPTPDDMRRVLERAAFRHARTLLTGSPEQPITSFLPPG